MYAVDAVARPGRPPGIRTGPNGLTTRQTAIVEFIQAEVARQGYPPSMREIGRAVKLKSTSSVAHQMMVLESKGILYRDPHRPRAYRVRHRWREHPSPESPVGAVGVVQVPLVGRIAAGAPILAEESVEDVYALPRHLVGDGELFALKVVGQSMVDAAICDGDTVVVRRQQTAEPGDIVAALLEGEATVKRFQRDEAGHAWLIPHNAEFEPLPADEADIIGKVVTVLRAL
ncbi:transcriptional repressor LexA [Streptomyces sp. NBC_00083]|uniref:transcriptional repressor LexA n=1 Tax=Streptomyces sp. NBC_00083 TaxID=2975647 RepID=UPI00224DF2CD|nr:transcriptional repressor LexA [Streptomyces sp. NBC_00083]MCX5387473.1 transcriptional repressor LexA [Streptomyces sp. NBC_00083]